jgi:hypothetical protein
MIIRDLVFFLPAQPLRTAPGKRGEMVVGKFFLGLLFRN